MMSSEFIWESTDSDSYGRLWEVNISAITALTTEEVFTLLELIESWGYQWDESQVAKREFAMKEDR